jgi:hypothetical protein
MASQLTLMILEKPEPPAVYRGFDRSWPRYQEQFSEDHPVNQAFLRWCDLGGASGELHDLGIAREICSIFATFVPTSTFEIIQDVRNGQQPLPAAEFLGYDVIVDGGSILSRGLVVGQSHDQLPNEPMAHVWKPLAEVMHRYFDKQLNEHGLFADLETARLFQQCIAALEEIRPSLYTGDAAKDFQQLPLKLYSVPN